MGRRTILERGVLLIVALVAAAVPWLVAAQPQSAAVVLTAGAGLYWNAAASRRALDSRLTAERAAAAAEKGAEATIPLQALKGRASYLGPRSVGHQDPGATSTALLLGALASVLEGHES